MSKEDAAALIEEASECNDLSKWEQDFLESVAEQVQERGFLSAKQIDILDRIIEEKGYR